MMKQEFYYQTEDAIRSVVLEEAEGRWRAQVDGRELTLAVIDNGRDHLLVEVDGRRLLAHAALDDKDVRLHVNGETWALRRAAPGRGHRHSAAQDANLTATMPGRVLDVLVAPGDIVQKGDTLVILEAMKMELRIVAPAAGCVHTVHCRPGQVVGRGQLLVEVVDA